MRSPFVVFVLAVAFAVSIGAPVPAAAAEDAIPCDGLDAVILSDGRVIRCRAGGEADGRLELVLPGGSVKVPRGEVAEVRRFADWDPEPRDDAERAKAAAGQVRWAGEWVPAARRDELRRQDRERQRKVHEAGAAHLRWENRWRRNTGHFAIEANIPAKALDAYAETLEAFYAYFTSAFKVSPKRPIPVYILRSRDEFQEFHRKDVGGGSENTVGYFVPRQGSEHLVLFDWQGDRAETLRVLLHECTHLLVYLANPSLRLPTFVNEGLAEYYGACTMRKGKIVRGAVQEERLVGLRALLEEGKLPDLETLLSHGHPDRRAPGWKKFTVDDYAHSWALVHFLFHGADGKFQPRLVAYLNGHWLMKPGDGAPGSSKDHYWMPHAADRDLFLRSLKAKDFGTLQEELLEYVRGLPLEGPQAIALRGMLRLRGGSPAAAEEDFREALARGADDPDVLAMLARGFSLLEGREKEAEEVLGRAIDLDPLNVERRYELSAWCQDGDAEIPHLRICAALAPEDPVGIAARAWLGFRKAGAGDGGPSPFSTPPPETDAVRAALKAKGPAPAAEACLRAARWLLDSGEAAEAAEAARAAIRGAPGDPAGPEALARAAILLGDPAEFVRAMEAFRGAATPKGKGGPAPSGPELKDRESRLAVEAAAAALAAGKVAETRRVLDDWFARPGREPRLEGEWILHAGVAALGKDLAAFRARAAKAILAVPGSERIRILAWAGGASPGDEE